MKKCKICGDKTNVCFNINLAKMFICESCAANIFLQQAQWYVDQYREHYFPIMPMLPKEFNGLKKSIRKYIDK